jgi:glycosyltransferase involved in cell wall biosynthesis
MTQQRALPRLVNLLDDFTLGGVSRGLGIFDCDAVRAVVEPSVMGIDPATHLAPRIDADVIVVHVPPSWRRLMFLASLRLRNPGARIIWVEHSYTPAWEALKVPNLARFHTNLSIAARLVDQIVCVSKAQAAWLEQAAGLPHGTVATIHPYSANNGVETIAPPRFAPGKPLVIGAWGRLHEQKGFDTLIAAHRRGLMPGTRLVIGGTGPDEAMLRHLAGESPHITFHGLVTDVAAFLEQVDVVALPSRWEAFGQVANEAREGARPIIVSPVDGLPEQAIGHATGPAGWWWISPMMSPCATCLNGSSQPTLPICRPTRVPAFRGAAPNASANGRPDREHPWPGVAARGVLDARKAA